MNKTRFTLEIVAIILVVIGLYFTYIQLQQNEKLTRDTYLTGLWNQIMMESIKYPQFQEKSKTSQYKDSYTSMERKKYEIYARWIGGFIEDLYYHDYEKEGLLFFEPTINTFLNLHCDWFVDHIKYYSHTEKFYRRIKNLRCEGNNSVLKQPSQYPPS